jgi:Fatty acid hydroxylase superfamily
MLKFPVTESFITIAALTCCRALAMETVDEVRAAEIARGRIVKRNNALTALLAGIGLALAALWVGRGAWKLAAVGALAGVVYANAFEYVLHRFVLHWGKGFLDRQHALHHDSAGAPNEARYVNFSTAPGVVILVFLLNAPPAFALERFLGHGIGTGMFLGFTIYYILYEEIHWRFHLGGWLPGWMRFARRHHLLHHGGFQGRYNVFLPLFDWILQRHEWKSASKISTS